MQQLASSPSLQDRPPHGPLGQLAMINFSLSDFLFAYRLLVQERELAAASNPLEPVDPSRVSAQNIRWAAKTLRNVAGGEANGRLGVALRHLQSVEGNARSGLVAHELTEALNLIESRIKVEGFFHYSPDDAALLKQVEDDWCQTLESFVEQSVRDEVTAAIDCLALGHFTACVFHAMRVAEIGLRAVATERGVALPKNKPVEWATWQEILKAITDRIKEIGLKEPAGDKKDLMLEFYNRVALSLNALKDIYRNQTMHVRSTFGRSDAVEALSETNKLMERIGFYIYADMPGPIDWDKEITEDRRL